MTNDVVVVTGASSGIGRHTALQLARQGASVVLAARDQQVLREVAEQCRRAGGPALAVRTDVAVEDDVQRLAAQAAEQFGRIDAWVNAAAVLTAGTVEATPAAAFRRVLETNLLGQVHAAHAVLSHFRDRGHGVLVNVCSVWGTVPSPFVAPYVVSKFGVRAFSDCLRQELRLDPGARHIHVCTVLPESVDTPVFQHAANYSGRRIGPVPPVLRPERVARTIVRTLDDPRPSRTIGLAGRCLQAAYAVAPGPTARLLGRVTRLGLFRPGREPRTAGNLFHPLAGWDRPSGHWRNGALRLRR